MQVMTERQNDQVSGAVRLIWSYMLDGAGAVFMIGSLAEPCVGKAIALRNSELAASDSLAVAWGGTRADTMPSTLRTFERIASS